MELEELRLRIREWKARSQGLPVPPREASPAPVEAAARAYAAAGYAADAYGEAVDSDVDIVDSASAYEDEAGAYGGAADTDGGAGGEAAAEDARAAMARLGLEVPEGESTAEILVPGDEGFEPEG